MSANINRTFHSFLEPWFGLDPIFSCIGVTIDRPHRARDSIPLMGSRSHATACKFLLQLCIHRAAFKSATATCVSGGDTDLMARDSRGKELAHRGHTFVEENIEPRSPPSSVRGTAWKQASNDLALLNNSNRALFVCLRLFQLLNNSST